MILKETFREEFDLQLNQLRRITSHGPSIGRFVEVLLISLLKKYLPSSIDFTSGFIKGTSIENPNSSCQIDIICYDRNNYPVLLDIGELKVVPSLAVKGMIEVKSTVTKCHVKSMLESSCSISLTEVPLESKMFLLSTSSSISAKNAFETIRSFYQGKPLINKFISTIYSLDWDEIIVCKTTTEGQRVNLSFIRLSVPEKNNIAIFIGFLIIEIYGSKAYEAIHNNLGPSLFVPIDSFEIDLYKGG